MARIGYARVSSTSQDLQLQTERLKAEGCEIVRSEKVSGATREGRGELATVLEFLRPEDELVVVRLDRLGRSTRDVLNLVHELDAKGAFLTVLEPHVTTKGPMGRMVLTVLGMVAEMELGFIRTRQLDGIARAKADKVYTGGKRRINREDVLARRAKGEGPSAIAKALGVSRMQIHRILKGEASASA